MDDSQPNTSSDRYRKWRKRQEESNPDFKLAEKERVKAWRKKKAEKLSPQQKEKRRKHETERKTIQRARKMLQKIDSSNTSTISEGNTSSIVDCSKFSPYKCKQTYCKAVLKCVKALPASPNKQKAVVMGVARKIGLNMELEMTKSLGPENHDDEVVSAVKDFYFRPDVVYTCPGMNDTMVTWIEERLNVLYERNWTRLVHEQLRKFESSIVAAARQAPEVQPQELAMDSKWTFSGALIYCITLITTIGYGNVSPRTAAGRAATVAYAAAGVPLTLACLAGLGASLARLARAGWLSATKKKVPNTWRKEGEMENHFQLHEQQRLLPQPAENNQYTSFPPRRPGTVRARAGERGQYSQVFERAPPSPKSATLGRVKRSALADEPHTSSALQTQTLDRKRTIANTKCLATVHGHSPGRGRGRTIQRPRGAVIEQLIAEECGELPMNRSQEDLEDSEDPDESICPHDTPSRVPLIWKDDKSKSCAVPSSSATSVQHVSHGIEHCHVPASIVLFLLLAYICVGAAIFSAWENWSFLDAAYFCFIALATIGFGDFVPTSFLTAKHTTENSKSEYIQMIACCAYLVFGLILIAMSFSLLQDEVVARCSQIANSLGLSRQ